MDTAINDNKNRLEEFISDPKRSLWKLALPMMFGMMVHSIYMLTDTYFIGNLVGLCGFDTGLGVGQWTNLDLHRGGQRWRGRHHGVRQHRDWW